MIEFINNGFRKSLAAVLFDMDGVITDSMPWHHICWNEVLERRGIHLSKEELYKREGEKGFTTIQNIFMDKGKTITEAEAEELLKEKEVLFHKKARIQLFSGIEDFIFRLAGLGVKVGLVTGTSMGELIKLLPSELIEIFKTIVTGDRVSNGKPHPEPYLKALNEIGVEIESVAVIENAPLGIKSAKAAGVFTIAVQTSLGEEYLREADVTVRDHLTLFSMFSNNF
ncbi:MAG: HAD family phosphatase [Acidobacteria bacterium]|nr:HAD family phosphatase [Acidobacteriota bacterium]